MSQSNEKQLPTDEIESNNDVTKNQSPHFNQFTMDGWSKVFDYLSLRDIIATSETCKQMQQIGGEYFRKKFTGLPCHFYGCGPNFDTSELSRPDFLRFIDTVEINGQAEDLLQFPHVNSYNSITSLQLCFFTPTEEDAPGFASISNSNIECIELYRCCFECDPYENFLKNCPKLRHLRIDKTYFDPISGGPQRIFGQKFPALQRLQYTRTDSEPEPPELGRFLELNPNVKCLQLDSDDFWSNRALLETLKTQDRQKHSLDCLVIEMESTEMATVEFADLLKAFYGHGFYKKLHLAIYWVEEDFDYQPFYNGIKSLHAFEVLYTQIFNEDIVHLVDLRELHLMELDEKVDLTPLAVNLVKIERLWIEGTENQLVAFLRHSKMLKTVVFELKDKNSGMDLITMNCERAKLQPTGKISIGIDENPYLTTKWRVKDAELEWIDLARKETVCELFEFQHRIADCT